MAEERKRAKQKSSKKLIKFSFSLNIKIYKISSKVFVLNNKARYNS